jgi:Ribbon-helix-helix protein, copG family
MKKVVAMFIHWCIITLKVEFDMSGQRDPNKKMIGLWLSPEERQQFDELAIKLGVTRSELIRRLVKNIVSPIGSQKSTN